MTDIADDVISLADELGLSITLGGGSVLGAARHRGFVPWDDDIDLNITRKEWEVFAPVLQERFEEKYFIYAPDSFSDAVINAIRIYKRGTKLREIAHAPNEPNGIFVDIFLLENAPDNGAIRLCHGVYAKVCDISLPVCDSMNREPTLRACLVKMPKQWLDTVSAFCWKNLLVFKRAFLVASFI